MKKNFIIFCIFAFSNILNATIYDVKITDNWSIYDDNPAGATITATNNGIKFEGSSIKNGYKYYFSGNSSEFHLRWDMKFSERYVIYVNIETTNGERYLYYTNSTKDRAQRGKYIHHGLGRTSNDGTKQTITRDLVADLQDFEPDNNITSIDTFLVRGNGEILSLELFEETQEEIPTEYEYTMYEDAQDGDTAGWVVYTRNKENANIINIFDEERNSRVIKLNGKKGTKDGYKLGNNEGKTGAWNNRDQFNISWRMKFDKKYTIFIRILTKQNNEKNHKWRYIYYSKNKNLTEGRIHPKNADYLYYGIDPAISSSSWSGEAIVRDLQADLQNLEENNSIVAVNAFLVRGNGLLDNIFLFSTDEENYMDLDIAISDAKTILEGNSGISNMDFNITLSAPAPKDLNISYQFGGSADGDDYNNSTNILTIHQGEEIGTISIPIYGDTEIEDNETIEITITPKDDIFNEIEATAVGQITNDDKIITVEVNGTLYEDAEDGNTDGWRVYDKNPTGATIANVFDNEKNSHVIKLSGDKTKNGFVLGEFNKNKDGAWKNDKEFVINWSMKFSENYVIYVRVETTDNQYRYLIYQPRNSDLGLRSNDHVYIGLGSDSKNDTWQTFSRDVKADFETYSDKNISAIHAFAIRGSGLLDDIYLSKQEDKENLNLDITVANSTITEGNLGEDSILNFNVILSDVTLEDAFVDYRFIGGDADENDYNNSAGILLIPAREQNGTIEVQIYGDDIVETNETINITASLGDNNDTAEGIIINDDIENGLTQSTETLYENGTTRLYNWSRSGRDNPLSIKKDDGDDRLFLKDKGRYENEGWNNTTEFVALWDMKASKDVEMFFLVKTREHGDIFVTYTSKDIETSGDRYWDNKTGWWHENGQLKESWGRYVYIKIDNLADGTWHSHERDLREGLHTLFADEEIIQVKAARIETFASDTNLYVDNIKLKSQLD